MNAKILTALAAITMALSTATWASTYSREQAGRGEQAILVEHHLEQEKTVEKQDLAREVIAAGLHPIVQTMAMVAPDVTEECAMALMSFDRKLKSRLAGSSATGAKKRNDVERREFVAAKAEKWASSVCGIPYGPCVDARIERKLLGSGARQDLRAADRKVEQQCENAS